jgi:hypothetical protein
MSTQTGGVFIISDLVVSGASYELIEVPNAKGSEVLTLVGHINVELD